MRKARSTPRMPLDIANGRYKFSLSKIGATGIVSMRLVGNVGSSTNKAVTMIDQTKLKYRWL